MQTNHLEWKTKGFIYLLLPCLVLSVTTFFSWKQFDEHNRYLEFFKANEPEKNTQYTARILNLIVAEIQDHTDKVARQLSGMDLTRLNDKKLLRLNQLALRTTELNIACTNDSDITSLTCFPFYVSEDNGEMVWVHPTTGKKRVPIHVDDPNTYLTKIYGSAIALAGNDDSNLKAQWSTYYYRNGSGIIQQDLSDFDYTNTSIKGFEWFHQPIAKNINRWSDPYLDDAGDTYMITYSAIIRSSKDETPIGVITADISINQLEDIIEHLTVGFDGFGALTNGNGLYIYHPESQYVKQALTLKDVANLKNDSDRLLVAKLADSGKRKTLSHISTTTGEESWLIIEPIPSSNWSLQNTFYKDGFYNELDFDKNRLYQVLFISSTILLIFWVAAIVVNLTKVNVISIWALSVLISILLAMGIGQIWNLALNSTPPQNSMDDVIDSFQSIEQKRLSYSQKIKGSERADDKTSIIPTGIYVQSIEIKNASAVNISGRIWQVYKNECGLECLADCKETKLVKACKDCMSDCKKFLDLVENTGIQFGNAKNVNLKQLKRELNEKGDIIVSWWFQADITTNIDYSRYPLEKEYLDLRILPASVNHQVFLVPDVASYKFGSNRKAGLSKSIVVPGWDIIRSYFALTPPSDNMPAFGMNRDFDDVGIDELHFKIGIKRVFIDAFISNLTPLIVVAIILFAVALLPNSIDISRTLAICVSVFFVIVFTHLGIRRQIAIGEIFYLEYFFFAIYLALLLVPVDAFRESLGIRSRFFEFKNGLIYKVLYWPTLMGIFYSVTALKFI